MTAASFPIPEARCVLDLGDTGRRSAGAAAGLTVGAAVALGVFFAAGEPWGTINDSLSIAVAWATVPIAVQFARRNPRSPLLGLGAASDAAGVAITTVFTALLISRRMTFEESLMPIMGGQALIGGWLLLAALSAWPERRMRRTSALGLVGGAGLIAVAGGLATGGMASPLAAVGFIASIIGTTGFYARLARRRGERSGR